MADDIAFRLAPWLFADEASRKEPTPIAGAFGLLPPELINHVIACLLRLPSHPHVSIETSVVAELNAHWVKAFVRTCKGARESISCAHVAEVIARGARVPVVRPRDVRDPYPYTNLVLRQSQSRIVLNVTMRAAHTLLLHCACARDACCKGTRDSFNSLMQATAPDPQAKTLSRAAMGDGTHARVSLVVERDAFLLCTTPHGAVVHQGDRIFCTGPGPNEVFVPGMEMATTFSVPAPRAGKTYWAAWHAESRWLTVCSCEHALAKYNFRRASQECWGENRCCESADYTLTTWDTARNRLVDSQVVHSVGDWLWPLGFLLKVWTCGDRVWMAFVATDIGPKRDTFELALVHYVPGQSAPSVERLPRCHHSIADLCVSESGHFAFLSRTYHELDGRHHSALHFYDVHRRRLVTLDGSDHHSDRDTMLLAPSGASMVLVREGRKFPEITVHTRTTSEEGMLGWTSSLHARSDQLACDLPQREMAFRAGAFSPCGSRALFLYTSVNTAVGIDGILVVDLAKTAQTGKVEVEWHDVHAQTMPSQVAWSEDGFFARSAQGGGVLRVGLVA